MRATTLASSPASRRANGPRAVSLLLDELDLRKRTRAAASRAELAALG